MTVITNIVGTAMVVMAAIGIITIESIVFAPKNMVEYIKQKSNMATVNR